MGHQTWIADRLRDYGLAVDEHPGWRTRGSANFDPKGVVVHHTASGAGDAPSLRVVVDGRSDLPGPLCHVLLTRSGRCVVIAAGRANHAGTGGWRGLAGNTSVLGIEAENNGRGEPWPSRQLDAFYAASAALVDGIGRDATWVCGHKEWTSRKIDPAGIDMNDFRRRVAAVYSGDDFVTEEQMATLGRWMKEQRDVTVEQVTKALLQSEWKTRRILADLIEASGVDTSKLSDETKQYLEKL